MDMDDILRLWRYSKGNLKRIAVEKGLTSRGFNGRSLSRMRKQDFIDFIVNQNHDNDFDNEMEEDNLITTLFRGLILEDTYQPIINLMNNFEDLDSAIRLISGIENNDDEQPTTQPNEETKSVPNEEDEKVPNLSLQELVDKPHNCTCDSCQTNKTIIEKNLKSKDSIYNIETKVTCVVCLIHMRNVVFSPCNHLATCITCSKKLDKCPLCRKPCDSKNRIFC